MRHSVDNAPVALVTGASGGIGMAIARILVKRGMIVWLAGRSQSSLNQVAARVRPGPGRTVARSVDVSSEQQVVGLVSEIHEAHARLDILVNSAGVCSLSTLEETTFGDWQEMLGANLTGTFLCCRAVVPLMRAQNAGRIVNIASVVGEQPTAGVSAYGATKAAVISLSRSLALELADTGVMVHLVCPTGVDTPMRRAVDQSDPDRWIDPGDVARVIADLLTIPGAWWWTQSGLFLVIEVNRERRPGVPEPPPTWPDA